MKKYLASLLLLVLTPQALWACAVCGFGDDGSKMGFIITTVILTFLPLSVFGGVVYYIAKRHKEINSES